MQATSPFTYRLLSGVTLMLGLVIISMSWSAHAETCPLLRVTGVEFKNLGVMQEGGNKVGVAGKIVATLKNTANQVYTKSDKTQISLWYTDDNGRRQNVGNFNPPTHIAPRGAVKITADKNMVLRRKPREGIQRTIGAGTFNMHCQPQVPNMYVDSQFVYDFTPVLTGGKPRRVSGRIKGGSSAKAPPRGRGAPAPRSR